MNPFIIQDEKTITVVNLHSFDSVGTGPSYILQIFSKETGEFLDSKVSTLDKVDWQELPRDDTAQDTIKTKLQDKVTELTAVAVDEKPIEDIKPVEETPVEEIKP